MKSFLYYTNIKEDVTLEYRQMFLEEFLIEAAGAAADSKGKLRELEVGQHINGGHMSSYRAEGKTPAEMHHLHSVKTHGEDYEKSEGFNKSQGHAKKAANDIRKHLKKFGYGDIKRTVWTSQPSDHKSETDIEDTNNSADLILTTSKTHKRNNVEDGKPRNENKIAVSVKTGSGNINYSNPGVASLSKLAGRDLSVHTKEHDKTVKGNLPEGRGDSHKKYKALRDSNSVDDQSKAAEIKHSSERMNNNVAHHLRQGLVNKSHEDLHKAITNEISPETHLKHLVSRQITNAKTGEQKSHHTYDLHNHVQEYLNHFHGLHVDPNGEGGSVTVHGYHKKTGKKMPVARFTIHAGGRPANSSPRGSTTLPSEDNKDINYTESSEHMEHN